MTNGIDFSLGEAGEVSKEPSPEAQLITETCKATLQGLSLSLEYKGQLCILLDYFVTSGQNQGKIIRQRLWLSPRAVWHTQQVILKLAPATKTLIQFMAGMVAIVGVGVELDIDRNRGFKVQLVRVTDRPSKLWCIGKKLLASLAKRR